MFRLPENAVLTEAAEMGAVDDRSVRVWLRQPGSSRVTGSLHVETREPVHATAELSATTDWTGCLDFQLAEPAPDRAFACIIGDRRLHGRLAPSPGTRTALCFAFGSCNLPIRAAAGGEARWAEGELIYPAMRARMHAAQARLLLLVGDQLYSDVPDSVSIPAAFLHRRLDTPGLFEQALAAYRERYRVFFDAPGFRALREQFPTYCIWDDHEIFDAWGSHLTQTPNDRLLFGAATRAYGEYQQQRNPGGAIASPPFHYAFSFGDVGFFVLDLRGERDYDRKRLIGAEQWRALQEFLADCDRNGTGTIFIVASVPIAHVARWAVLSLGWIHESVEANVRDRWCSEGFVRDRDRFLAMLFRWQAAPPRRQAILLSGDVHAASAFTIRQRNGPGVVQQFNSSAFSHPLRGADRFLNRVGVYFPSLFEPRIRIQRHALVYENNFGLVRARPLPGGGHSVEFTVHAWQPRRRRLRVAARVVTSPRRSV